MERILRFADKTVQNQTEIDKFLAERRKTRESRSKFTPTQILSHFDLKSARLEPTERKVVARLELSGSKSGFTNTLYEEPHLQIELTPEPDEVFSTPRRILRFKLRGGEKFILIDASFDDTQGEYWEHYKDKAKVAYLVQKNLLNTLSSKKWAQGNFGDWYSTK